VTRPVRPAGLRAGLATPAAVGCAAAGAVGDVASKQREALAQAYAAEAQKFGLPAIAPQPKVAFDKIALVDTSKYKKAPPYKVAHAAQGPTNSWASLYDAAFEYELRTNTRTCWATSSTRMPTAAVTNKSTTSRTCSLASRTSWS